MPQSAGAMATCLPPRRAALLTASITGFRRCRHPEASQFSDSLTWTADLVAQLRMSAYTGTRDGGGEDDILISGGQVIDGTGAPGRAADVAIRAGLITAIEANRTEPCLDGSEPSRRQVPPFARPVWLMHI